MSNVNPQYGREYAQNVTPSERETRAPSEMVTVLSGWTMFSGILLMLAGAFGAINGLIALMNRGIYVIGEEQIVLFNLRQWGWIHVIGGAFVAIVGLVVLGTGAWWARIIGVIAAMFQAIAMVAFIEAYPFWTIATIAIDVAVIYGLLVPSRREPAPEVWR